MPDNSQNSPKTLKFAPSNPVLYVNEQADKSALSEVTLQITTGTYKPQNYADLRQKINQEKQLLFSSHVSELVRDFPQFQPAEQQIKTQLMDYSQALPTHLVKLPKHQPNAVAGSIDKKHSLELIRQINAASPDQAKEIFTRQSSNYQDVIFNHLDGDKKSHIFNHLPQSRQETLFSQYQEYRAVRTDIIIPSDQEPPALDREDLYSGQLQSKLLAMGYTPETYSRIADEIKSRYYDENKHQWTNAQQKQAYENAIAGYEDARNYLEDPHTHTSAQQAIEKNQADPKLLTFSQDGLPLPLAAAMAADKAKLQGLPDVSQDHALAHYMTDNAPDAKSAQRLWSQTYSRLRGLFSRGQDSSTVNSAGRFVVGANNSISRLNNAMSRVKTLTSKVVSAPKKLVQKAIAKTAAKVAAKLGLKALLGAVSAGIGWLAYIPDAIGLLRRHWKKIIPAYFGMSFLLSLLNPLTWIAFGWRAITNWFTGGATGAAASQAAATGSVVPTLSPGAMAQAVTTGSAQQVNVARSATTGQIQGIQTQQIAFVPSETLMTTSTPFLLTSAVGPFGLVFVLTLIIMTQMLTAFTVPNPLPTQFGATDNSAIPGLPVPTPGSGTGPGQGDGSIKDAPANMQTLLSNSAQKACLPTALLAAVLQVESSALNYRADQVTQFNTPDWWLANASRANCYDNNSLGGDCKAGYCYDTCAFVSCAAGAEVRGASQFEKATFYGTKSCDPQGIAPYCTIADNSPASFVAHAKEDSDYVANRCLLSDAILASAYKLARDSGNVTFGSGFSCTYNAARWDPNTAKASICLASRAYCGSCGAIENPSNPNYGTGQPCEPYYRKYGEPGYASTSCGGESSLGHCNMVYNNYIENLN